MEVAESVEILTDSRSDEIVCVVLDPQEKRGSQAAEGSIPAVRKYSVIMVEVAPYSSLTSTCAPLISEPGAW